MRRSLVSLSVVTAMWEQRHHDYLDNFVPFVATLLDLRGTRRIERDDVKSICDYFATEFELVIPFHPMTAILNPMCQATHLRREGGGFTAIEKAVFQQSFKVRRGEFVRKEQQLLKSFREFCKNTFDLTISPDDAEDALLSFLRHHDIEILFASHYTQTALPPRKLRRNKRLRYALSKFLIEAHRTRPDLFRTLCDIALGHMITAAILLEDYDWSGDTVRGTNLYLDTPIILKLIGTDGVEQADVFASFVSELCDKGAGLWIFEHSIQEVTGLLDGARNWVISSAFDASKASRVALFFRQSGFNESDIQRFILRVDSTLARLGIKVFGGNQYLESRRHQIDEVNLQRIIERLYSKTENGSWDDVTSDTVLKDVASISAVYRLRAGRTPTLLRQAEHVFVTTNAALARASGEILGNGSGRVLPACVTDTFVGTTLWIDSPEKAGLARRRQILADCHSAVRPDASLEARIVAEARKLQEEGSINEDDYVLLTTSFVTKDLLSEKTMNDVEALDGRTAVQILQEIKGRARSEGESDVRRIVRERDDEERAKMEAELRNDKAMTNVKDRVTQDARRIAKGFNILCAASIAILALVPFLVDTIFGSSNLPLFGGVSSMVAIAISAYFASHSFLASNFEKLFSKYRHRLEKRYLGDDFGSD